MKYRTSFQCPDTGETVIARYAFGRITIVMADDAEMPETFKYCQNYTNIKFNTFEAANDFIIQISDGQTFGFEVD